MISTHNSMWCWIELRKEKARQYQLERGPITSRGNIPPHRKLRFGVRSVSLLFKRLLRGNLLFESLRASRRAPWQPSGRWLRSLRARLLRVGEGPGGGLTDPRSRLHRKLRAELPRFAMFLVCLLASGGPKRRVTSLVVTRRGSGGDPVLIGL